MIREAVGLFRPRLIFLKTDFYLINNGHGQVGVGPIIYPHCVLQDVDFAIQRNPDQVLVARVVNLILYVKCLLLCIK